MFRRLNPAAPTEHIAHSGIQPCCPGHIDRPCLQPLRQHIRHIFPNGFAARAAEQQWGSLPPAQQQPRALGTQQPLVAGSGNKLRPQGIQLHRQRPSGLGCIQNKGHTLLPAQGSHFLHRQNIAEHVGHMGKYRRIRPGTEGTPKLLQGIVPVKQPPPRHLHLRPQGIQRAHHRIVFKPGHRHAASGLYQTANGNIQAMGAIGGEHHLLRAAVEKLPRRLPAGKHHLRPSLRRPIAAPPRAGTGAHRPLHRPVNSGRLMEGGGTIIQVNHSTSSSRPAFSRCQYTFPMGSSSRRSSTTAFSGRSVRSRRL